LLLGWRAPKPKTTTHPTPAAREVTVRRGTRQSELEEAIGSFPGAVRVLIDLSNIVFISSTGIHALLRERDPAVALVCPPGNVMRLFEIVRASNRVAIYESLDEALQPCVA
jgi:anti-anti-sigma regulatory factor